MQRSISRQLAPQTDFMTKNLKQSHTVRTSVYRIDRVRSQFRKVLSLQVSQVNGQLHLRPCDRRFQLYEQRLKVKTYEQVRFGKILFDSHVSSRSGCHQRVPNT